MLQLLCLSLSVAAEITITTNWDVVTARAATAATIEVSACACAAIQSQWHHSIPHPPLPFLISHPSNPFRCGIWMLLQVDVMPFLGRTDYGGTRALLVAVFFNTPVYSDCTAREWRLKTSRKMDRVPCSIV